MPTSSENRKPGSRKPKQLGGPAMNVQIPNGHDRPGRLNEMARFTGA